MTRSRRGRKKKKKTNNYVPSRARARGTQIIIIVVAARRTRGEISATGFVPQLWISEHYANRTRIVHPVRVSLSRAFGRHRISFSRGVTRRPFIIIVVINYYYSSTVRSVVPAATRRRRDVYLRDVTMFFFRSPCLLSPRALPPTFHRRRTQACAGFFRGACRTVSKER